MLTLPLAGGLWGTGLVVNTGGTGLGFDRHQIPSSSFNSATVSPEAANFSAGVRGTGGSGIGAGSGVLPASSQAVNSAKSRFAGSGGMKALSARRRMLVLVVSW